MRRGGRTIRAGRSGRCGPVFTRGSCAPAAPTGATIARAATGFAAVPMSVLVRCVGLEVGPDGLKHHVEVARDAEPRAERGNVHRLGTKVMEHRGAVIEQRLDVDELPRPIPVLEHTLAESEATRAYLLRSVRAGQVLRAGQAKYALPVNRGSRFGILARRASRRRAIMRDQNFSQLQAAMRLDHHDLAPLEGGVALRKSGESPYVTHDAIADQVRVLAHSPRLLPGFTAGMNGAHDSARALPACYKKQRRGWVQDPFPPHSMRINPPRLCPRPAPSGNANASNHALPDSRDRKHS